MRYTPRDIHAGFSSLGNEILQGFYTHFINTTNPTGDKVITALQAIQYGLHQFVQAAPPNEMSAFWDGMPLYDQFLAQAESEYHQAYTIPYYRGLVRMRKLDTMLDSIKLEDPDSPAFARLATFYTEYKRHERIERVALQAIDGFGKKAMTYDNLLQLLSNWTHESLIIPVRSPPYARRAKSYLAMTDDYKRLWSFNPDSAHMYSQYQNTEVELQHSYDSSYSLLRLHLHSARINHNSLSGPAAKTRTLLANHSIPLPTLTTFLAWWAWCGFESMSLRQTAFTHFPNFTHYLAFTHPHLTITKENSTRVGSSMQTEETNANHSLPARSSGHVKTKAGRVVHGRHEMWGDFINVRPADEAIQLPADSVTLATEFVHNNLMNRPHKQLRNGLPPLPRRGNWDAVWGVAEVLSVMIQDPWVQGGELLHADWSSDYPISTPFRSIAKDANMHFMFTDDAEGRDSLAAWHQAMVKSAIQYIQLTQRKQRFIPGMLNALTMESILQATHFKTPTANIKKLSPRFDIDFGDLNLG